MRGHNDNARRRRRAAAGLRGELFKEITNLEPGERRKELLRLAGSAAVARISSQGVDLDKATPQKLRKEFVEADAQYPVSRSDQSAGVSAVSATVEVASEVPGAPLADPRSEAYWLDMFPGNRQAG